MEKLRIGVIGCGNISDLYFMNLMKRYGHGLDVIACADLFMEKAQASAEKHGIQARTVDDLLADEGIELVVNLTNPGAHYEMNRRILEAGKHVYCEKPFALTFKDAKKTVEYAESKELMVASAPDTFLGGGIQTCRQLIDEGWVGTPIGGTANFVWPGHELWHPAPQFYYQTGGGPMMDMGPYYVTALVSILGPIKSVFGKVKRSRDTRTITSFSPYKGDKVDVEVPTHYVGIIEFQNGAVVNINMSFDVWCSEQPKLEIYGTMGAMYCSDPDWFCGPVRVVRGESIVDSLADLDMSDTGVKGNPFDFSGMVKEVPLRYYDPRKKTRGLGVLDLASAIRTGRKARISHALIVHVIEALTAFEKSSSSDAVYRMVTTCERPAGIPLDFEMDHVD